MTDTRNNRERGGVTCTINDLRNSLAVNYLPVITDIILDMSGPLSETEFEQLSRTCVLALLNTIEDFAPPTTIDLDDACKNAVIQVVSESLPKRVRKTRPLSNQLRQTIIMLRTKENLSARVVSQILDIPIQDVEHAYKVGTISSHSH